MIKLIALDMDGTVLDSQKNITAATKAAIIRAVKSGVYVIFSTGRSPSELQRYSRELPEVRYGNCESGAAIYDFREKKMLECHCINLCVCEAVIAVLTSCDVMYSAKVDGKVHCDRQGLADMSRFNVESFQPLYNEVATPHDNITAFIRTHADRIEKLNLYFRSAEDRQRAADRLRDQDLSMVFAGESSIEFTPGGISKASGLASLCRILGVDLSDVMAIGDADNDLTVLQSAGFAVAMGNGNDHVKAICDAIVADNDHDGVAEAIEKYVLNVR